MVREHGLLEGAPGREVGGIGAGGHHYNCYDANDPAFLARMAAEKKAREDAAREAKAEDAADAARLIATLAAETAAQAARDAHAATPEGRAEAAAQAARDARDAAEVAAADAAVVAELEKAHGLIRGYKRCMVSADSTLEARRLNAYERTLYSEYLQQANANCRAANRCDWVEKITGADPSTDTGCSYNSPGVN